MGKNLEPSCKQCRRIGEKLMLKGERCNSPKCAMVKRNFIPGFHGPKAKGAPRKSEYGTQLSEKQKAKKQYGLMEKQFRLVFEKAKNKKGNSGENLLILLEERLDNVIYRTGFACSRAEARQMVSHKLFTLNKKRVSIPSILVKQGDEITLTESAKRNKKFKNISEKLKNFQAPGWINFDKKELLAKILHEPKFKDITNNIDIRTIVEFYSR